MNSIEEILIQQQRRAIFVNEDFVDIDSEARLNVLEADASSTVALATGASAVGGALLFTAGTTADFEAYAWSQEVFKFAAGKTMIAEARVKITEGATNLCNTIFGFMSGVATNALLDDDLGPAAAYSGALIYKTGGSLLWKAEASVNGGATQYGGTSTLASTATWQTLRVECHPLTATRCDVSFFVDDAGGSNFMPLKDSNLMPLKYEIDTSSVTEMSVVCGIKAGSVSVETLLLDKISAVSIR